VAYFKAKVDAGADAAITQYFYNADAYFQFVDYCTRAGIEIPIVPGIMPITNYGNLARFSANCGAEIPRWLAKRLTGFGDDVQGLRSYGIDVVTDLCQRLLDGGAPGLHFYSMNLAASVSQIWTNLALSPRK
jgi:methylenetetrahydrofolate reductase (NADPH)